MLTDIIKPAHLPPSTISLLVPLSCMKMTRSLNLFMMLMLPTFLGMESRATPVLNSVVNTAIRGVEDVVSLTSSSYSRNALLKHRRYGSRRVLPTHVQTLPLRAPSSKAFLEYPLPMFCTSIGLSSMPTPNNPLGLQSGRSKAPCSKPGQHSKRLPCPSSGF